MRNVVALALLLAGSLQAQVQQAQPTNNAPNPYNTVEGWAKMPPGRAWGATSAVDIANDGASIWVAERCAANSCAGSTLDPILRFDANGNFVRSFGAGLMLSPHGIHVDRDGNLWVTDCACTGGRNARPDSTRGHLVYKFSPDGKRLLTLGRAGGAKEPYFFWQPNDVVTAPNGDIYVAEGHSDADSANARILKFDRNGKFLRAWGRRGSGVGEMMQPHALAMDSKGRLYVGDRSNNRILVMDQTFNVLAKWEQFGRPSGIYIRDDTIYIADSESGSVARNRTQWQRGIRIGSVNDGKVVAFIPDPASNPPSTSAAEGVAVDRRGNIYGAEVGPRALKRYVRKQQ